MAEFGASPSPSSPLVKNDMTPERTLPEAMDTYAKAAAVDAILAEALNAGPNEVAVVRRLQDATNMGAKELSVGESYCSEASTPLQADPIVSKTLNEPRAELLERVQALKKALEKWQGRLDTQVKSYSEELGKLRSSLNSEVEQLRIDFQDLRNTLKQQRELTSTKLAKLNEPSKTELPLPTA